MNTQMALFNGVGVQTPTTSR